MSSDTELNTGISTIRDSEKKQSQLERCHSNPSNQESSKVGTSELTAEDNENMAQYVMASQEKKHTQLFPGSMPSWQSCLARLGGSKSQSRLLEIIPILVEQRERGEWATRSSPGAQHYIEPLQKVSSPVQKKKKEQTKLCKSRFLLFSVSLQTNTLSSR